MKSFFLLLSRSVCLLLSTSVVHAQGVGTSGEITGTVVDPSGAVVAKASVTAVEPAKGIQHSTVTDGSGHYRFKGLPPAVYNLTVEASGFATEERRELAVALGETVRIDFHLRLSAVAYKVEVTADTNSESPVVDVERASQANTLDERYIDGLPIDRRDYLSFSLLMPGVSESL